MWSKSVLSSTTWEIIEFLFGATPRHSWCCRQLLETASEPNCVTSGGINDPAPEEANVAKAAINPGGTNNAIPRKIACCPLKQTSWLIDRLLVRQLRLKINMNLLKGIAW
jgi:hypothetical protein